MSRVRVHRVVEGGSAWATVPPMQPLVSTDRIVDDTSSFDHEPNNDNLLVVVSCTTQAVFQNNSGSSSIHVRNTIHIDHIDREQVEIPPCFATNSNIANGQFRKRFRMRKRLFM
uniref:Uncharacterized protein n=1 Tax=Lactuca sativa TaxID=4236 RepID=A0A9R1WKZ3_LACSA|nr:hypothetical protein LSAT_V11C100041040 [Lactuca sativa]